MIQPFKSTSTQLYVYLPVTVQLQFSIEFNIPFFRGRHHEFMIDIPFTFLLLLIQYKTIKKNFPNFLAEVHHLILKKILLKIVNNYLLIFVFYIKF